MPTVDIELMFPAGTADEPAGKRGIALIAAGALHAPSGVATEMLRFVQAGGSVAREATPDHTLFAVQGLAANIDILLDGLSLVVRGGEYDPLSVRDSASWLQLKTQGTVHDRAARVAWRSAVYGSDHPYARAGIWAYADRGATDVDALRAFRAAHYVPDGATLVIAGHFDPHEADRWIDEEFGKWTGHAAERHLPRASPQPFGFALAEDKPEISVAIAIPVDPDARVADELAAEMLQEAISDVREELAASYGLHAYLEETAASTSIVLEGQVDARRAAEVFALVRERIAKLHEPSDDTASIFVSARRHVVARLGSVDTRPAKLAARFVHEADLGLLPGVQLQLAETARVFTIDRLLPALGQLDLGRAAILLRGPRAALDAAYGALGRTPAYIQ
jgi:predicted Zn-dependent peptidase